MEFKMPTESVTLPSKGLIYAEDNPLRSGIIEMKYMTAKEEDILTNSNFLKNGTVVDKLLQSMIVSQINYNDLISGDKNAILIAARILGYGKDYEFSYIDKKTGQTKIGKIDLTTIVDKEIDESLIVPGRNEFSFTLPYSGNEITFKILTHGDDKEIDAELRGLKKIFPEQSFEVTTRLKHMIVSIGGSRKREDINMFVDKMFTAKDAKAFRDYYNKISPDIELKFYPEDTEEGVDIPVGISFFWPDA
jgi:hypothetical protein